ncbi:uncharacterized protein G2W53_015524 [Senna tora]|uniref:Uncharacterized protein n=1 Tax=Senna tora TaxID=362788 RepID=A0A835C886_9FABA|nr:uncharacterized protein G2W53_015524 [Senna tora]
MSLRNYCPLYKFLHRVTPMLTQSLSESKLTGLEPLKQLWNRVLVVFLLRVVMVFAQCSSQQMPELFYVDSNCSAAELGCLLRSSCSSISISLKRKGADAACISKRSGMFDLFEDGYVDDVVDAS